MVQRPYEAKDHTVDEIAALLGCGRSTIYRAVQDVDPR